jgi:hypothetical protein
VFFDFCLFLDTLKVNHERTAYSRSYAPGVERLNLCEVRYIFVLGGVYFEMCYTDSVSRILNAPKTPRYPDSSDVKLPKNNGL